MDITTLKARLEVRAKAFISDPDLVTGEFLGIAVCEALEIAGASTDAPVLMDIAFYRFLLLVEQNGVSDEQFKAYQLALKQITDPDSPNAQTTSKAKTRVNRYQ